MKPLAYLMARSLVNGFKRALTSARRLISLIVFAGYYLYFFVYRPGKDIEYSSFSGALPTLSFPPLEVLDAVVFGLFMGLTLILALGITGYKGSFRPADVDVLFATPLNPKHVLIFRIVRDYLVTLLIPLFLVVVTWRPASIGLEILFQDIPQHHGYVQRAAIVAWLLVALTWVCMGYAASLFINRSDLKSETNKRILIGALVALGVSVIAFVIIGVKDLETTADLLALAQTPFLRIVFFTATAATAIVMAPLYDNWWPLFIGVGGLIAIIVVSLRIAITQVGWMYDQAAVKGFSAGNSRKLQQSGDMIALAAEHARRGKISKRRFAWLQRIKTKGALSLIWKEALIQLRSMMWTLLIFVPIVMFLCGLAAYTTGVDSWVGGAFFLVMQGFGVFLVTMPLAQSGFIEVLRRVDLQKPLPFTPSTIIFYEVMARAIPASIVGVLGSCVALIINPGLWQSVLGATFLAPSIAVLMCATIFLITILFPDLEDATQRGFRGLVLLFALMILCGPVALVFAVLFYYGGPIVASLPSAAINIAISLGVTAFAAHFYANYNPAD